jgi:hypothetical protein
MSAALRLLTYVLLAVFLNCLALEDGTDGLLRNVCKELTLLGCVKSQKSADLIYVAPENLQSHIARQCGRICLQISPF